MAAPDTVVNLADKLTKFEERFSPRIVAQLNDFHIKLAKLEGEFVWHQHSASAWLRRRPRQSAP